MKTYKGQIDETWTEIDLSQFKKENPKYKDADKVQKLSDLNPNTLLSAIARAEIKEYGFYTYYDGITNEKIVVEA